MVEVEVSTFEKHMREINFYQQLIRVVKINEIFVITVIYVNTIKLIYSIIHILLL